MAPMNSEKLDRLKGILREMDSVIVAYSGGLARAFMGPNPSDTTSK